ncbi:MAG: hypothetical protein ACHQC8_03595 [Solirubrobacterales bacterium]
MAKDREADRRRARAARAPGMADARRMLAAHAEAERTGVPVDEALGAAASRRCATDDDGATYTRRSLLLGGAGLIAGAAVAASPLRSEARNAFRRPEPRITIVGGGLAGLRCAHLPWTGWPGRPIAATVYEANPERAQSRQKPADARVRPLYVQGRMHPDDDRRRRRTGCGAGRTRA